jgi:iron(III) transport system substrate-binding protein
MTAPGQFVSERHAFYLAAVATLAAVPLVSGQPRRAESPHKAIYQYQGADREARLAAEAAKEGEVVVYTSLNLKDSVPLTEAFEKKTGLKVQLWRASSEKVLQRALTEARAGRFSCDVIETNGPELEAAYREGLLEQFHSPHFADLPEAAFPKHRHYVAGRFNFFTIGYNTNLVKPEEVPNSYEDLIHPRWAGRVGIEGSDMDWFAAVVKSMGEKKGLAYFRKLAAAKPQIRTGHTLMAELVASGEIPLAVTLYNHNVERLLVKGAPVKWKPLAPTFGRPNAIGLARRAPHPHAALVFADFFLSKEGQTILKERNRVPSSRLVDTHLNKFPFEMIDPVITLDESTKWEKLWSELFLGGKKLEREAE